MRWRIVFFFAACSGSAACTSLLGDFGVGPSPSDAGAAPAEANASTDARAVDVMVDVATVTLTASVSDVSVYLGQPATLDASKSTTTRGELTFQWSFKSKPQESHLTDGALTGATSPRATFMPDVMGEYDLQVVVSAFGMTDTQTAKVAAVVPQVLFAQGTIGSGGQPGSSEYIIAEIDGGNPHPVLCAVPPRNPDEVSLLVPFAACAGRAYDYWEAPAGQLSRFAAFTVDFDADAGVFSTHLWSGSTQSTCSGGSTPVALGSADFGLGRPYGSEPHFNADGTRFAVFDRQWRILTYAADAGSSDQPNVISTYQLPYPQAASFLDPVGLAPSTGYVFEPPRVTWTATGLAWAQPTVTGWEVVTAPDAPNATLTTYMTCPGITPREIAMMPDGTVIASYRLTPQSSENLYRLKPDAQQNCSHEVQYTLLSDAGSSTATDFAISPDATQIAFVQIDTAIENASPWFQGGSQWPGGYVYVVPVAGGTPVQVSSEPAIYGPRWIGGGTALVFTRFDGVSGFTGKPATSVIVIRPDGGGEQLIAQGDGTSTFVSTSGNAACTVIKTPGARASGIAVQAFAMLLMVTYRLRRRARA